MRNGPWADGRIVVDHQGPVERFTHVELDSRHAQGHGVAESHERVFAIVQVGSAVRKDRSHLKTLLRDQELLLPMRLNT